MTGKPFHNPFGALAGLRDRLPAAPQREPASEPAPPAPSTVPAATPSGGAKPLPRVVIRLQRSGRGGKEVTVVEQLAVGAAEREAWLKALKTALGCGGTVEGDTLVLQGDQRTRLPALLTARGVRKVTVG